MSTTTFIIALVTCILAQGFFSGTEIAIVNADKYRLALKTSAGSRWALSALHMVKNPALFFSTTIFGANLSTVTGSAIATIFIIDRFGEEYAPFAALYSLCSLVFGELVPKSLYQHYSDRVVLKVAPLLLSVSFILYPFVWFFSKLTDLLLGGVQKRFAEEPPITREELETMLHLEVDAKTDVRPHERRMISRIFDLTEKTVAQIMTPLANVVAISVDDSREKARDILEKSGYARLPMYEGQTHNILGVLNGNDLLFGDPSRTIRNLVLPAYFVPEEMPLDTLLVTMKRKGLPLAVVVDEYGAATGIVSSEDLLEEIVGEIRDEHDETLDFYERLGPKRYLVDGRMEIAAANERLKLDIPEGDYATIAGFLIHHFEHIPKKGENIAIGKYHYTVHRATERAVHEVEIVLKEPVT